MPTPKDFKILIVDDDLNILNLIEEEFKHLGYDVSTATSGNEAIKILESRGFDVVISDFRMPDGNGMAVLSFVNTMKVKPTFYFVSALADLSIEDCLRAGAKRFFSKPFDIYLLIDEVTSHLAN